MPTYTITAASDNGRIGAGNTWEPAAAETIDFTAALPKGGLRFTGIPALTVSTGTGLTTSSPTTPPATQQATRFASVSLTLTLSAGVVAAQELRIDLVDEADPAAFATGDTPDDRTLVLGIATADVPLGPFLTTLTVDIQGASLARVHAKPNWNGKLAFRLVFSVGDVSLLSSVSIVPPRMVTTEVGAESGIEGLRWVGGGVYRDFKTHEYVRRDEAVEDGYRRGRFVDPENYDPPDDRLYHRARSRRRRQERRS